MLSDLYRRILKFFLGGSGLSIQTGKYFGESMLVGLAVGFIVVGFRYMIDFMTSLLLEGLGGHGQLTSLAHGSALARSFMLDDLLAPHRLLLVVLPPLGAALGYFLIKWFSKVRYVRGTDNAIKAYHHEGGYVTGAVIPIKSVASVLTVASGGSGGYEGPVTLIGAACGSTIARSLKLSVRARRILMAAGLAAGISALFRAPLAGAIFGFEVMYSSSDIEYENMLPSFVASAISYTVYTYFFGWGTLFTMPADCVYENGLRLLPYLILAIIVVFGTRFYIVTFRIAERWFSRLKMHDWVKVMFGGLLTGIIGFFVPDILGSSYPVIQAAFTAGNTTFFTDRLPLSITGFICFFFMKAAATACTVGSGGSAGVFAPALVCGGSLGAATGLIFAAIFPESFGIRPAAFALVGMAGFLASAIRIPITAVVMVAEISGNHGLLLPAMWVCGIAFWLNSGWSLYRSQPHCRESSPVHRGKFF